MASPCPTEAILRPLDDVPRDGSPIVIQMLHSFRWMPYIKETSAHKNKHTTEINGVLGRWQTLDQGDHWVNCEPPQGLWASNL
jgi:hypothetical protein